MQNKVSYLLSTKKLALLSLISGLSYSSLFIYPNVMTLACLGNKVRVDTWSKPTSCLNILISSYVNLKASFLSTRQVLNPLSFDESKIWRLRSTNLVAEEVPQEIYFVASIVTVFKSFVSVYPSLQSGRLSAPQSKLGIVYVMVYVGYAVSIVPVIILEN